MKGMDLIMKKLKEKLKYGKRGITLIALVVTIVVLLILAGVTIATLFGDNGIISKAQDAKQKTEDAAKKEQQLLAGAFERNFATYNGQLHIEGTKLMNEHNEQIRLKGVTLGDLRYSEQVIKKLKEWGTNVIKVGISYDSDDESCQNVYSLMDQIINQDMYVIITFWSGNDLNEEITEIAKNRFEEISQRYGTIPNVIYEIANEPSNSWNDIKKYANTIIPIIRNINSNAIILSPTQAYGILRDVIGYELDYENIMYVTHIYNGNSNVCRELSEAHINGLPVFVSEWSNRADNSVANNELTDRLVSLMDRYSISSTFWILSESTREGSVALVKNGMWDGTLDDKTLTDTGLYFKRFITKQYSEYKYAPEDYSMAVGNYDYGIYFWSDQYREHINKIITTNNFNIPKNIVRAWDISNGSGNIIAYIINDVENDGEYILYIATQGDKIYSCNGNSRTFARFNKCKLIDLTYFDLGNTTTMEKWFQLDSNLEEIIGLNNFNTTNIENMNNLFAYCQKLKKLDLSSFCFNKVNDYTDMFYGINYYAEVYVKDIESATFIKNKINNIAIYYGDENNWTKFE